MTTMLSGWRSSLTMIVLAFLIFESCSIAKKGHRTRVSGQEEVVTLGFWNLENLFDTIDQPDVRDSEFTPSGKRHYDTRIYREKLGKLAEVIAQIGKDVTPDGVAILGVSEVENYGVLKDLVKESPLKAKGFQVIHRNSPDERGIDVGMLYQPKYFHPSDVQTHPVFLYNADGSRDYTRDVLEVTGDLLGERIHYFVNHWPSRSGGEEASRWRRDSAAAVARRAINKVFAQEPQAKIFVVGDFNDNPNNESVVRFLRAGPDKHPKDRTALYNTTYHLYKSGIGSTAYRDAWSLFDQAIVSIPLLEDKKGWHLVKTGIFNRRFMINSLGKYKGYPKRSFVRDTWQGGYSDHFPVYMYVVRPK